MLTSIDLFCGAGGLSLGLEAAGFQTAFAVEMKPEACATYSGVLPHVHLHKGRIENVSFKRWRGVDLVAGGPPCQPFSSGGKLRGRDDDRDMLPEFIRAVTEAMPRAFLLENVPGLAGRHRPYLQRVLRPLVDLFEISEPMVINVADFGVPQKRRRMVVVGIEKGKAVKLPTAMQAKHSRSGDFLTEWPEEEANTSKVVYAKSPDIRPSPYDGQLFNGGGRPIQLEGPSPTILASAGGNKTPFLDVRGLVPGYHAHLMLGGRPRAGTLPFARRLTVAECALLQTFPPGMRFHGARSAQYEQVGNAVPLLLAAALGESIASALSH